MTTQEHEPAAAKPWAPGDHRRARQRLERQLVASLKSVYAIAMKSLYAAQDTVLLDAMLDTARAFGRVQEARRWERIERRVVAKFDPKASKRRRARSTKAVRP
jgi:hypothetical protein